MTKRSDDISMLWLVTVFILAMLVIIGLFTVYSWIKPEPKIEWLNISESMECRIENQTHTIDYETSKQLTSCFYINTEMETFISNVSIVWNPPHIAFINEGIEFMNEYLIRKNNEWKCHHDFDYNATIVESEVRVCEKVVLNVSGVKTIGGEGCIEWKYNPSPTPDVCLKFSKEGVSVATNVRYEEIARYTVNVATNSRTIYKNGTYIRDFTHMIFPDGVPETVISRVYYCEDCYDDCENTYNDPYEGYERERGCQYGCEVAGCVW